MRASSRRSHHSSASGAAVKRLGALAKPSASARRQRAGDVAQEMKGRRQCVLRDRAKSFQTPAQDLPRAPSREHRGRRRPALISPVRALPPPARGSAAGAPPRSTMSFHQHRAAPRVYLQARSANRSNRSLVAPEFQEKLSHTSARAVRRRSLRRATFPSARARSFGRRGDRYPTLSRARASAGSSPPGRVPPAERRRDKHRPRRQHFERGGDGWVRSRVTIRCRRFRSGPAAAPVAMSIASLRQSAMV